MHPPRDPSLGTQVAVHPCGLLGSSTPFPLVDACPLAYPPTYNPDKNVHKKRSQLPNMEQHLAGPDLVLDRLDVLRVLRGLSRVLFAPRWHTLVPPWPWGWV